jgi:hypothetical protein
MDVQLAVGNRDLLAGEGHCVSPQGQRSICHHEDVAEKSKVGASSRAWLIAISYHESQRAENSQRLMGAMKLKRNRTIAWMVCLVLLSGLAWSVRDGTRSFDQRAWSLANPAVDRTRARMAKDLERRLQSEAWTEAQTRERLGTPWLEQRRGFATGEGNVLTFALGPSGNGLRYLFVRDVYAIYITFGPGGAFAMCQLAPVGD